MSVTCDTTDRHQTRLAAEVPLAEAAGRCGVPAVDEFDDAMALWGLNPTRTAGSQRIELTSITGDQYGEPAAPAPTIVAAGLF